MRALILLLAMTAGVAWGQGVGSPLPSTSYTRLWLRSVDAEAGRTNLGIYSTNDSVILVTNYTYITNTFTSTNLNAAYATNSGYASEAGHATNSDLASGVVAGITNQWKVDATNAIPTWAANATNAVSVSGATSNGTVQIPDSAGVIYLNSSNNITSIGGTFTLTNGARTFSHDGTSTIITNSTTKTGTVFGNGYQKEYYNGTETVSIDKTNGAITANTVNTTNLVANLALSTNLGSGSFRITAPTADNSDTNWICNLGVGKGLYKEIFGLTTNFNISYITNGPGAATYLITSSGGNRSVSWPQTWWVPTAATNEITKVGTVSAITLTNFIALSVFNDGATNAVQWTRFTQP